MNLKKTIITGIAAVSFLALASSNVKAVVSPPFTNSITIKATAVGQGGTNNNGSVTTVSNITVSVSTKQVLAWLAVDENAEAKYGSTTFPTGAQLLLIEQGNDSDFQVVDKNGNFLVDVRDVISLDHGDTTINSAKISDSDGLFSPSGTQMRIFDFDFNDTNIGGGSHVQFYLQGLETKTVTDSSVRSGKYTQSVSVSVPDGAGDGSYLGIPFVISGTISISGKESISIL